MGSRAESFVRAVAFVGGVGLAGFGVWAFFAPQSFFDTLAVFPPYNRHFIHDIGSFQIGLGAVLLLALYSRDALFVALAGVGAGSAVHLVSHIMDRDIGGKPASDIPLLAALTLLLIAGAVVRRNGVTEDAAATREPAPRP